MSFLLNMKKFLYLFSKEEDNFYLKKREEIEAKQKEENKDKKNRITLSLSLSDVFYRKS